MIEDVTAWLRNICKEYSWEARAVYRTPGEAEWPLHAADNHELERLLRESGAFLPLPSEPAALANIVEVSVLDFLLRRLKSEDGVEARRGTERAYPDLELTGQAFGGAFHAVDIKVARYAEESKKKPRTRTQSRITLYTGNTYFRYPKHQWPGNFRAFDDYASHVTLIVLYSFAPEKLERVSDIEVIVQETWRIASKLRSSTTREYLGAVQKVADLRQGKGDFSTQAEFYEFWRKHPFKIAKIAQNLLDKLLASGTGK